MSAIPDRAFDVPTIQRTKQPWPCKLVRGEEMYRTQVYLFFRRKLKIGFFALMTYLALC